MHNNKYSCFYKRNNNNNVLYIFFKGQHGEYKVIYISVLFLFVEMEQKNNTNEKYKVFFCSFCAIPLFIVIICLLWFFFYLKKTFSYFLCGVNKNMHKIYFDEITMIDQTKTSCKFLKC